MTLKERTSGTYTLDIELVRDFKELPKSLVVAGVHPLDTAKLTGFVAVSAEPGVAVKTEMFEGLTEIPAVSLPDYATMVSTGNLLAYKFISAAPKVRARMEVERGRRRALPPGCARRSSTTSRSPKRW